MHEKTSVLGELSQNENDLIRRFRNGTSIDRARIIVATHAPEAEPIQREMSMLRAFAAYLECSDYGRERCLEAMEIFASSTTIEEEKKKIAEADQTRAMATVISLSDFR